MFYPDMDAVISLKQYIKRIYRYRLTGGERFAVCGIDALAEVFCGYFYSFEKAVTVGATVVFDLALIRFYGGKFHFPYLRDVHNNRRPVKMQSVG